MNQTINTTSSAAIDINEVVHYLACLVVEDGVEPVVSEPSKYFAIAFNETIGSYDGIEYMSVLRPHPLRDEYVSATFDDHQDDIYAVLTPLVESDYNGSWAYFMATLMEYRVFKKHRLEIDSHMPVVATFQTLKDAADGKLISDHAFTLNVKAALIADTRNVINDAFYAMHGVRYFDTLGAVFAQNHEKPFPRANILYS